MPDRSRSQANLLRLGRTVLSATVGEVRWSPPRWPRFLGGLLQRAGRRLRRHPLIVMGAISVLLSLSLLIGKGVVWYRSRPRPIELAVTIAGPTATPLVKHARPSALVLRFSGSAAPIEAIGKPNPRGVALTPRLPGLWVWRNDRELRFTPKEDWPVGRELTVRLEREVHTDSVRLDRYRHGFLTPGFELVLEGARFHEDPRDPTLKMVVATLRFSHPVDAASLVRGLRLELGAARGGVGRAAPVQASVRYDELRGRAFVHSAPLPVPELDRTLRLSVGRGVRAARGGPGSERPIEAKVLVPGRDSLRIESARVAVVFDAEERPSHRVVVETNRIVASAELGRSLDAHLLPLHHPLEPVEKDARPYRWADPSLIGPEILRRGQAVALAAVGPPAGTLHSFQASRPLPVGRTIYALVRKGLRSVGGYRLALSQDALSAVPPFPPLLKFVHSGAVLGPRGEKSVAVVTRDLPGARLQIGRVLPGQIHHLVAANQGGFATPSLRGLREETLSEVFREVRALPARPPGESQHFTIDLAKYLDADPRGQRRGLFLLRAEGFDPIRRELSDPEVEDRRLILITDLGLLVKDSADGSHDVFVVSLATGAPVAGASVELLGRNGRPLASALSDRQGHARIGALPSRIEGEDASEPERRPTLYLVRRGADLSFLPYGRSDRSLDTSRFDVGGTRGRSDPRGLTAFVFSDRGLYRPGDEARFGLIVKRRDWNPASLAGLPLELSISDPRGRELRRETLRLGRDGFESITHRFSRSARQGYHHLNLHLVKDGKPESLLGHTSVEVRELEPDRMRIKLALSADSPDGWLAPRRLAVQVSLQNLFGTPAAGRSVRARMVLYPRLPRLPRFAGHSFRDRSQKTELREHREELPSVRTDEHGRASLPLRLERFNAVSYQLEVEVEGFEAEGGRSVGARIGAAISPLPFLVGYRADGGLEMIPRGSKRAVELRAVGSRGAAVAARGLRLELRKQVYRSVLTRQTDGSYRYESVGTEQSRWTRALQIPEAGLSERLPTEEPGEYLLLVRDAAGELNRIAFSVAGEANLQRSLERDAELELQLDRDEVAPGEELRLRIKAPYAGAGLITVERERVHGFRWFKTSTTESVQVVRVPAGLEGNGYLSVTLVRDPSSAQLFASPLSHGIVGFTVRRQRRTVKLELEAAARARAGEPLVVRYRTDRPARVLVFAVDEGILRVARYTAPDPLAHFLRKRALEVRTTQILDLILPEARKLIRKDAAPGGGDDALGGGGLAVSNRNPFARRHRPPLAFWSGILEGGPGPRELRIPIPDEFSGALRLMAVAVAPQAVGAASRRTQVRADFVITPHAPGFVAPGDELEVGVAVANTPPEADARRGRGAVARVILELGATSQLELLGPTRVALEIPELGERSASFRVRAREQLGPATLRFVASSGARRSKLGLELSVRPAAPFLTTITAGAIAPGARTRVSVSPASFHREERVLRAGISSLPLALADGLRAYLDRFPHGCSEQLVSKAVPALVLADRAEWGGSAAEAERALAKILSTLRERQNEEGAFGLWAANPNASPFATVYALHLLLETRERGHAVPKELLWRGFSYLRGLAGGNGGGLPQERLRAYAIYVLTRAEYVSGAQATALHRRLRQLPDRGWRSDIAAAFLAASFQLLREEELAEELIRGLRFGAVVAPDVEHFHDCLVHDAQLLYLLSRHFPARARELGTDGIAALAASVGRGAQSTLSSAFAILALDAHARANGGAPTDSLRPSRQPQIQSRGARHQASEQTPAGVRPLSLVGKLFARGSFAPEARALRFQAAEGGAFYSVLQAGYERELPGTPIRRGLEVHRELCDEQGRPVSGPVKLGRPLIARIRLRALGRSVQGGIAIVDLLPGGFDPHFPSGSNSPLLPDSSFRPESTDGQEDRLLFYGQARPEVRELRYRVRPTVAGRFRVPPIKAESLYDRSIVARGVGGVIVVER